MAIPAKFAGGPLDRQTIELPGVEPFLEVLVSAPDVARVYRVKLGPSPNVVAELDKRTPEFPRLLIGTTPPFTRYVKHFERRGVAHYYIPAGG